ncbi:hypothetical protein FA95DRAFT_1612293 [Auriscalpium vulgare]|uniref:Uncharacterized protein n=1 Tax=Auriscalpium vulgare TaxID=40419 RepID=A0ACB8R6W9_9AGAM|nr:hypothetical protein FA95DRAFT_1612293 [Auriscalpium vulgare]
MINNPLLLSLLPPFTRLTLLFLNSQPPSNDMANQSTLRAFLVTDVARYVHVGAEHRQLDGGLSLPAYADWFSLDLPVRTAVIRAYHSGKLHTFVVYYILDRTKLPTPSRAAQRWRCPAWHGELLVFRQRSVSSSAVNKLVNIRSSDTAVLDLVLDKFFRRIGVAL